MDEFSIKISLFCLLYLSSVSYLSFDNGGLLFTKPLAMDVDVDMTYNGESFKAPTYIRTSIIIIECTYIVILFTQKE